MKYYFLFLSLVTFQAFSLSDLQPTANHSFHVGKNSILIVSLNFHDKEMLQEIGNAITAYYHLPVSYKHALMPATAFSPYGRNRYDGNKIIAFLKTLNNGQYRFVAGLTDKDICTESNGVKDWGIFGLGSLDNSGCISSSKRLSKNVTKAKLLERLTKVVFHEIGHNMGLPHCKSSWPCFMKPAEAQISVVDKEPMDLCKSCKEKVFSK